MVVQQIILQYERSLEHCVLLSVGCLGITIIASFLLLRFQQNLFLAGFSTYVFKLPTCMCILPPKTKNI